jgi:hypothetical protein
MKFEKMSKIKTISEGSVSMQVNTNFYKRMTALLFKLGSENENLFTETLLKIKAGKTPETEYEDHIFTVLIFVTEFERLAEENNLVELQDESDVEAILKKVSEN